MNDDVRDLGGRLFRLFIASVIGTLAAIAIAICLPLRDHLPNWRCCFRVGVDDINVALVIAGAVVLSLGCYALLGALARRRPRALTIPRAIVARDRSR